MQIDFTISPRVKNQDLTLAFEGFEEKGEIHCQWVLWLKESVAQEETYIITRVGRRAPYDAEIYYESGEQEKMSMSKNLLRRFHIHKPCIRTKLIMKMLCEL